MGYTKQQVEDAHYVGIVDGYAYSGSCSAKSAMREDDPSPQELARRQVSYKRGKQVLREAKLLSSAHVARGVSVPEVDAEGETIIVSAGHRATNEMVRRVGLKRKKGR